MTTRELFIEEALLLLEQSGPQGLTTRAVCSRVGVKAPTLFHHFGALGGLLDAAITAGFYRFLEHKRSQRPLADLADDLLAGWDNYVDFAREHPKLYTAMAAKYATGTPIPAAQQGRAILDAKLTALAAAGRLNISPLAAAEIAWSTAHAAAMLIVSLYPAKPTDEAIAGLRASVERLTLPATERGTGLMRPLVAEAQVLSRSALSSAPDPSRINTEDTCELCGAALVRNRNSRR